MSMSITDFLRGGFLALSALGLPQLLQAAPVSPEAAMAEASDFLHQSIPGRKAAPSDQSLTLAYSAGEDGAGFYIFNHKDGFVIISADDRLPMVLGYSDNGAFDYARIPENFKWWLGEYQQEIAAWLPTAPENLTRRVARAPIKRNPIAPMTKTTWNQDAPYNNDCPLDNSGQRSVTGCVATAMAQLMKYHEWPAKPKGSSAGVVFDGTTYDWANMIDDYKPGNYTSKQASAVATLMRQCGAAVNMMYSSWSSGAYDMNVPVAFTKFFNYGPEVFMVWKDYTPLSTWTEIVYGELAEGRPLYYSGSSSQGGHAFVCDGYSDNDFFHFNWGWGGYQDGYFRLTALNPASGGAGSYEGGYNSGQTILTGLKPNKSNEKTVEQVALLSTGGFYYSKDNVFNIQQDPRGFNLIYNPMAYQLTLSVGIKIVEIDNPSATPQYVSAGSSTIQSGYGLTEFTASVPTLPDGTYSITPVFSQSGKDWQPILIPLGKQNYVRLTVSGGKKNFENAGPDDSNKANLIANMPYTTPKIYGNADMAFRVPVLNVGKGDYMGNLGFTLIQEDDDFGDSISLSESAPVSGKGYSEWDISFNEQIKPGSYLLFISDDEGEMLIDGEPVTVVDGDFPDIVNTSKVKVSDLAPNFIVSDSENPIYFTVESSSIFEETVPFRFTILDGETLKKVTDLPDYSVKVPAKQSGRVTIPPRDLGVAPGRYMWYVADHDGNALCTPTPLIVTSSPKVEKGLTYIVTDEQRKLAQITSPDNNAYAGSVSVPEKIGGYTVEAIKPDAFAFATASAVTLPATITELPDGGFYDAYNLRSLTLDADKIVEAGLNTFYPKYTPNCWLVVPEGLPNQYHQLDIWKDFAMTRWKLELDNVEIISGMEVDPATGAPYSPYYVNFNTPLSLGLSAPEGYNVNIITKIGGQWVDYRTIDPKDTKAELPALGEKHTGHFIATATHDPVAVDKVDADAVSGDVFSIDGRVILRDATPEQIRSLDPGLYIIAGRKHRVK